MVWLYGIWIVARLLAFLIILEDLELGIAGDNSSLQSPVLQKKNVSYYANKDQRYLWVRVYSLSRGNPKRVEVRNICPSITSLLTITVFLKPSSSDSYGFRTLKCILSELTKRSGNFGVSPSTSGKLKAMLTD